MSIKKWSDFEKYSKDFTGDFERMCRLYFKIKFFNKEKILQQSNNNPGIEVEPVFIDGKYISFQSKYFATNISYVQITSSIKNAIKHYKSKLDIIYLFVNKDLTLTCESYRKIFTEAKKASIEIVSVANESILEDISHIEKYKIILSAFFGELNLSDEWFIKRNEYGLDDLGDRYSADFNVKLHIQDSIDLIFENKDTFDRKKAILLRYRNDVSQIKIDESKKLKEILREIDNIIICTPSEMRNLYVKHVSNISKEIESLKDHYYRNKDRKEFKYLKQYENLLYLVNAFLNYLEINIIMYLKNNVVIVEGEAGSGKSHLMGYSVKSNQNKTKSILLLGQKLINQNNPWDQIQSQLNLQCARDEFFNYLEGLGAVENTPTVIVIDAINECAYYSVWRAYLNSMINEINNYKYIKLIITIRTTYQNQIFEKQILDKISNGYVLLLQHPGFRYSFETSVPIFLKKYGIPSEIQKNLPRDFSNPLLLKLFCETYDKNQKSEINVNTVFEKLINKENEELKKILKIETKMHCENMILSKIIHFMEREGVRIVKRSDITELEGLFPSAYNYLNKMLFGSVLFSFHIDGEELILFRYDRMYDYLICRDIKAKYKAKKYHKVFQKKFVRDVDGIKYLDESLISTLFLSINSDDKYLFADKLLKIKKHKFANLEIIVLSIIDYHSDMSSDDIQFNRFEKLIRNSSKKFNRKTVINHKLKVLLLNSLKTGNPLNANYLSSYLIDMKLNERDLLWTTYIDQEYTEVDSIIDRHIEKSIKSYIDDVGKLKLELILLTYLLTSANRKLRDRASRALVNMLVNNLNLSGLLLKEYDMINDPYITQRILGCIYGAVLKSDISTENLEQLKYVSLEVYDTIFNKTYVTPDILLRDYARNIIEYALYQGLKLDINVVKIRPPYNSIPFPSIDIKKVRKEFYFDSKNDNFYSTALFKVRFSMMPNARLTEDNLGMYGDFGRYVFESGFSYFKDVDLAEMYYYALNYIKNELGLNKMFDEFDSQIAHRDRGVYSQERIGKKYQWIATYMIWATVSDHYEYKEAFSEEKGVFNGPWKPYVRDFDPSQDLELNDRIYNFDYLFKGVTRVKSDFTQNFNDWFENNTGLKNYKNLISFTDNNQDIWMSLFFSVTDKSTKSYSIDRKKLWREAGMFFCNSEDYDKFKEELRDSFYWGRWFYNRNSQYELFARELFWSPAYNDINRIESEEIKFPSGEKYEETVQIPKVVVTLEDGTTQNSVDFFKNLSVDDIEKNIVKYSLNTIFTEETLIKDKLISFNVIRGWKEFLWEEQYDMSKKDSSIGYLVPPKTIVDHFKLNQKKCGLWFDESELVCADFSLIMNTEIEGLFIRKDYLDKMIEDRSCKAFWVGLGEQNFLTGNSHIGFNEDNKFKQLSTFISYIKGRVKVESMKFLVENSKNKNIKDVM